MDIDPAALISAVTRTVATTDRDGLGDGWCRASISYGTVAHAAEAAARRTLTAYTATDDATT